ncbi:alpha/beta fold hydrolase [Acidicapsa dinghuensis]|uniref:Alpha/beta fold hydrolase n=1 Tax=Acidicapsa dinghuensis TaxID=2218256 RepID=A0ABW1EES4_9BACT|nr:alpha/beta hydrolase [Acidicapsa dinghuensis]
MGTYRTLKMSVCALFAVFLSCIAQAQSGAEAIHYGANPAAGHYLRVDDVNIYYETYGSGGTPLVLLHGGLYGYIEEFGELIQEMSKHRRVIAIATRGHGKSEIGSKPFSYALFANDAYTVIRHETSEKVDVLGFSDGAVTSYTLASAHPELVRRLVAIGGPRKFTDWTPNAQEEQKNAKPSDVERDSPQFVAERKKLMPQPERWIEFNEKLNAMWLGPVYVTDEQIESIKIPTLIIAGDHDPYNQTEKFVELYQLLPQGELALIPGCGHVVLNCKGQFTIEAVEAFLDEKEK